MDKGPALISQRLENWAKEKHIELFHVQPGKSAHTVSGLLRKNAYSARFNCTYREEVLDAYLFDDLNEVCSITAPWLEDYDSIRPLGALQGISLRQFALQHA